MFGFVGPNGAGKTTAMRIVLGVLAPTPARCAGAARPSTPRRGRASATCRRSAGCTRRCACATSSCTSRACTAWPAGTPGGGERWIERLGLDERAGDRVETLSLGNQQRVQLAVALVHEPELLVLDEPFSGLDPVGVDVMSGVLRERADAGVPVVFSSHQLELVERLCEDVAIVNGGRLVAAGAVDELRERGRGGAERVRVRVEGDGDGGWLAGVPGAELAETRPRGLLVRLAAEGRAGSGARRRPRRRHRDALQPRAADAGRPVPRGGGGVSGRTAIGLVARREIAERAFEKSFVIGTVITLVIIVRSRCCRACSASAAATSTPLAVATRRCSPSPTRPCAAPSRSTPRFGRRGRRRRDADGRRHPRAGEARRQARHILQAANAQVSSDAALREAGLDEEQARQALHRSRWRSPPSSPSTRTPRTAAASRSSPCCCSTGS